MGIAMTRAADPARPSTGNLLYRFEARLSEPKPVGLLPEGLRLEIPFEGPIVEGPLAGARLEGVEHLLIRPDGVAVIDAPETISRDGLHMTAHAWGYVTPPPGVNLPPLDQMLAPDFEWPDLRLDVRGFAILRTADPDLDFLNRTAPALRGWVNMGTRELSVEAIAL